MPDQQESNNHVRLRDGFQQKLLMVWLSAGIGRVSVALTVMTMPQPQQPPGLDEPAPPPRRNVTRKVLAIVAAGVVLLGGLVFAVIRIGPSDGFPRSE